MQIPKLRLNWPYTLIGAVISPNGTTICAVRTDEGEFEGKFATFRVDLSTGTAMKGHFGIGNHYLALEDMLNRAASEDRGLY